MCSDGGLLDEKISLDAGQVFWVHNVKKIALVNQGQLLESIAVAREENDNCVSAVGQLERLPKRWISSSKKHIFQRKNSLSIREFTTKIVKKTTLVGLSGNYSEQAHKL